MNGLFGLELPTSVNFVIAFVVVLALIGAATWLVRRFGAPRLDAGARNRQPRLAVIDSAAIDGRRKLVIIRRDNVEHLLMIGGPSDVVVETNIVRAAAAVARETPAVRANGGEPLPRAMPLPDTTHWPLQPEPVVPAAPQWNAPPEQPAPHLLRLSALRAKRRSSCRAAEPPQAAPAALPVRPVQPAAVRAPAPSPAPRVAPVVQIDPQVAAANDQNLANMAHQLEAALRRPVAAPAEAPKPAEQKRVEPVLRPVPKAAPAAQPALTRARRRATETARAQHRARNGEPAGPSREKLTSKPFAACVRLATVAAIALLAVPAHAQDISINFGQGGRPDRARDPVDRAAHGAVARAVDPGDDDVVHPDRGGAVVCCAPRSAPRPRRPTR